MMNPDPTKEHLWLQRMVGDWDMEGECVMGPDQPPMKSKSFEQVKPIGSLWVIGEGEGEMPGGGAALTRITLGYDPQKGRFVGTFIGSMMTHLWLYEGTLDAAGKVLTLDCEGPSFAGDGTMAKYQDIIEMKSDDHRVMTSRVQGADGKWTHFMTANYRRKK
ncbi:DUF1579 domain-containing protein [Bradyrhizobium sp. LHD-71]|uniref:DUF1579 domain-containing protein n=1 Tax=Bradyrhizobium sp. LHD-71 TaxID=3072141 RepID=UPI0028102134|nr:DUF1579 domain-containing protein [Bradyrhizobium sp. LHD-71]MDQ8730600.1 DUF1579 domain-containing protein [Bradyrhizobium sp. LHD-71]